MKLEVGILGELYRKTFTWIKKQRLEPCQNLRRIRFQSSLRLQDTCVGLNAAYVYDNIYK
jgi:hypothetical protein